MTSNNSLSAACDCGSGQLFALCCGRYLQGQQIPANAEQLMRSRFTAFRRKDIKYLSASWWPDCCPFDEEQSPASLVEQWMSLDVTGSGPLQIVDGKFGVCAKASSLTKGHGQRVQLASASLPRLPKFLHRISDRCEWQWVRFEAIGYQPDNNLFFRLTEFSRFVCIDASLDSLSGIDTPAWLVDRESQNQWCYRWLYLDGVADWSDIEVTRNS